MGWSVFFSFTVKALIWKKGATKEHLDIISSAFLPKEFF